MAALQEGTALDDEGKFRIVTRQSSQSIRNSPLVRKRAEEKRRRAPVVPAGDGIRRRSSTRSSGSTPESRTRGESARRSAVEEQVR